MYMCKDMIAAVFVIPVTLGAVTELQIFIIQLCPSADRTLMDGSFGLRTHGDHISPIRSVHHLMGIACILSPAGLIRLLKLPAPLDLGHTPSSLFHVDQEENAEGHNADNDHDPCVKIREFDEFIQHEGGVDHSHPFHLHGYHQREEHHLILEDHRQGQEHGQQHIPCGIGNGKNPPACGYGFKNIAGCGVAVDQIRHDHRDIRQQDISEHVQIQHLTSPDAFQLGTDKIIEIQRDGRQQIAEGIRERERDRKDPGDQPPPLMMFHHHCRIQQQIRIKALKEISKDIPGDKTPGHNERKTRDRKSSEFFSEFIVLHTFPHSARHATWQVLYSHDPPAGNSA